MKRILFVLGAVLMTVGVKGQSKWGSTTADSVSCYEGYNIFGSYYQSKNYLDAFEPWLNVYQTCPGAKKATFIYGPKIVETKIKATTDAVEKQGYIDILVKLYDDRLIYFPGKEGYVLMEKAVKYSKYVNKDSNDLYRAIQYFDTALATANNDLNAFQLNQYFKTSLKWFYVTRDPDKIISAYTTASEIAEFQIAKWNLNISEFSLNDSTELSPNELKKIALAKKKIDSFTRAQRNMDVTLAPNLTCDKLAIIYSKEKFKENKDDLAWLKRAVKMLQKERNSVENEVTNCNDNVIFIPLLNRLYELEPSATSARSMAKFAVRVKNWAMAKEYYTEAINQELDPLKASDDHMGLAFVNKTMNDPRAAKDNYLKAARLRTNWGEPYYRLAILYADAAGTCDGDNAVEKKAVYWAAINKLNYARSIDASIVAAANERISVYKRAAPDKSIAFQLGVTEGEMMTIACWIDEIVMVKFY